MEMKEKFCVIFKKDGHDMEAVKNALHDATLARVYEEEDSEMEYVNDGGKTISENVHIFYMEGPLMSRVPISVKFNCFDLYGHPEYGDNGKYILFPRCYRVN